MMPDTIPSMARRLNAWMKSRGSAQTRPVHGDWPGTVDVPTFGRNESCPYGSGREDKPAATRHDFPAAKGCGAPCKFGRKIIVGACAVASDRCRDLLLAGLDLPICIPIARKPSFGAALRSAGEVMSPSAEPYRVRSLPTRTCPP